MEKNVFTHMFGDSPKIKVIDFLMSEGFFFSVKEIAEGLELSKPTVYKIIEELLVEDLIKLSRTVGNTAMYSLNFKNKKIKMLREIEGVFIAEQTKLIIQANKNV